MKVWICNSCHAEVGKAPEKCPLCGASKGFEEAERPDTKEDEYSKLYKKSLDDLEKYDEGCEPESLKYSYED
jgi:predicted ATP-dependent serine protease